MILFPENITVNNKQFRVSELFETYIPRNEWEKDWFEFLKEWYSPAETIEVQTSGSTGFPKTIQLAKNFVAESASRTISYFELKKGDKILHCLPFKFIAGKLMLVRALIGELDLTLVDPKSDFSELAEATFSFAAMVPNQVIKLLKINPELRMLKKLLIGGDAVPKTLAEKLQNLPTECFSSYGMTETATHIAIQKINGKEKDDWYRCLEHINVGISNQGCLQIFMPGLKEQPLETNDLAELLDEHTFRILGRFDNIIISGGIKYSPELLEKKLESVIKHPFQMSALPHEKLGQQLVLLVESEESETLHKQLKSKCNRYLTKFERPRKILFVREFLRTENGKIKRQQVF